MATKKTTTKQDQPVTLSLAQAKPIFGGLAALVHLWHTMTNMGYDVENSLYTLRNMASYNVKGNPELRTELLQQIRAAEANQYGQRRFLAAIEEVFHNVNNAINTTLGVPNERGLDAEELAHAVMERYQTMEMDSLRQQIADLQAENEVLKSKLAAAPAVASDADDDPDEDDDGDDEDEGDDSDDDVRDAGGEAIDAQKK